MSDVTARRFAGNASLATVLHFSSAFITLSVAPYALKKIGLETYGLWALLTTLTRYALLADFGIGPSITRHVAQYIELKNTVAIRSATTIGMLYNAATAIPVTVLAVFAAPIYLRTLHLSSALYLQAEPLLMLFVFAYLVSLISWSGQSATLSGYGKFGMSALVNATGSIIYTISAYLFLWLGCGAKGLIYATLAQGLACGIFGHFQLWRIERSIYLFPWKIDKRIFREIISFGAWSQIGTVANLLIYDTPALVVGSTLGISAVGILDIGTRLARAIRAVAFNFSGALLPAISSRHASQGSEGVLAMLPHLLRTAAIIAFTGTGLLIAASPIILPLWLGNRIPNFQIVEIVIGGVSITYTIEMLVSVVATSVRGSGLPWLEAWYTVTYALSNLMLLLVLTPRIGLLGSIVASLTSVSLAAVVFVFRCDFEHVLPRSIWSQNAWLIKTVAAWGVTTTILFLGSSFFGRTAHNKFVGIAVLSALLLAYVACKSGLLILLRAVDGSDVTRLRAMLPARLLGTRV